MTRLKGLGWVVLLGGVVMAFSGCSEALVVEISETQFGARSELGNGTVSSYVKFDGSGKPLAIGLTFSADAFDDLPSGSDFHHCFDRNEDGVVDPDTECLVGHEWVIPLPSRASGRSDIPFKWALLNWNPQGHIPPRVYDSPHFDVHFYMEPIENIFALEPGPCGPEFARCDQFELATKPLPPNYIHPDFQNVDAVVPAMGNHLIDLTGPEFQGEPFTRSWTYGVFDAKIIFYEEMLTLAYILSQPNQCFPIKSPAAVGVSGYYPTQSCTRYNAESDEYTVSIEEFVPRNYSAPDPIPSEPVR